MTHRTWLTTLLAMIFVAGTAFAAAPDADQARPSKTLDTPVASELDEILYDQGFEDPIDNWTFFDPAVQPVRWMEDGWMPRNGENSWRAFNPEIGDPEYGGYDNDWLQVMLTPMFETMTVSELDLNFWFRAYLEDGEWDGANVWVFYGNDPDNMLAEIATPVSPAYTEPTTEAFSLWFGNMFPEYPAWAGEGGEPFNTDYVEATFDLDTYAADYDYVQIAFAFSSDGAYNSADNPDMFGFQIDDISVTADGVSVFLNGAEGDGIGGEPTFMSGAEAAGQATLQNQWSRLDLGDDANTGMYALGIDSYEPSYDHYYQSPELDPMPELADGEGLRMDTYFNSVYEDDGSWALGDRFYWRLEVFNPAENAWQAASNVGGWSGNNYVYPQPSEGTWELFSDLYGDDWNLDAVGGQEGVRIRAFFHSPDPTRTFDHFWLDDIIIEKTALQYDLSTMLMLPYPTTVGVPVYGKAYFTNNAPNTADNGIATWSLNGAVYPMYPTEEFNVAPGETAMRRIDNPTDDVDGYWVPTVEDEGMATITATHTYSDDEIIDNNTYATDAEVMAEGYYEVGADTRNFYGSLSVHNLNDGPVVHLDPAAVNPGIYDEYFDDYDIGMLTAYGYYWNNDGSTGGAPANAELMFKVMEGGATPGTELWSGMATITDMDGNAIAEGYEGNVMAQVDVSGVAELQDLTGSFYVQAVLTQTDANGVYAQPLMRRTGAYADWQAYQFYNTEDANNGDANPDYGHHITATLMADPSGVETADAAATPNEFALHDAYPNPFNPSTTLNFTMAQPGDVRLTVYNALGQEVAQLVDGQRQAGDHTVTFDASGLTSGIYFVRMQADGFTAVNKVVLMK